MSLVAYHRKRRASKTDKNAETNKCACGAPIACEETACKACMTATKVCKACEKEFVGDGTVCDACTKVSSKAVKAARTLIAKRHEIAFTAAFDKGEYFDDVKDQSWFVEKVARRVEDLMRKADMDDPDADDLYEWVQNDSDLYRQQHLPCKKNLAKKKHNGTYDSDKAVKLMEHLADSGAKSYCKQLDVGGRPWHKVFPKKVRTEAAKMLRDNFENQWGNEEYDFMKHSKEAAARMAATIRENSGPYTVDIDVVKEHDSIPAYVKLVEKEVKDGKGLVDVTTVTGNTASIFSHGSNPVRRMLGAISVPVDALKPAARARKAKSLSPAQTAYREFFQSMLKDEGVSSPAQLEDKSAFFKRVKTEWAKQKKASVRQKVEDPSVLKIRVARDEALELLDYHEGMDSNVCLLGTRNYAGEPVPVDIAASALRELKASLRRCEDTDHCAGLRRVIGYVKQAAQKASSSQ